ncbi:MAG: hybrid sensor histidine kinase/response regulator [Thermodesulfobacteriota bacterium]
MATFEILMFDDGSSLFRTLAWVLDYKGLGVKTASTPEAALELMVTKNYDLLIAKLSMDGNGSLEVIKRAHKLNPETRIMVVGGDGQVGFPLEAYRLKIDDYILLPCTPAALWRRVADCLGSLEPRRPESASQVRLAAINEQVLNKLAIMFHDLRSSMVSSSAALKLLLRGDYGGMDEPVAQKIREISSRIKKIVGVSEEFMAQVLSGNGEVALGPELLDLKQEIVDPVLDEFAEEIQDHGIIIDNRLAAQRTAAIPIRGSKLYLKSVFRNLLSNGIRHGGNGSTIVIDLEEQGDNFRLKVCNSSSFVPEENRSMLFSHNRRPGKGGKPRGQGLGIGLHLVKGIIKEHGGDLLHEAKNHGSDYVITLPH